MAAGLLRAASASSCSVAVAHTRWVDRLCSGVAIAGVAMLALRRWMQMGSYPTGLDGAQWLALGRGLHGFGRATGGVYAPLTPALATLLDAMTGPMLALRLLAALSGIAVGLAIWLTARAALGPVWGLLAAALAIPASALTEPLFYGGYPQQLALAAGLMCLWTSCRFLTFGTRRDLAMCGVTAFITAAAHHVYAPLFFLAIAFVVALSVLLPVTETAPRRDRLRLLALTLLPGLTLAAALAAVFVVRGYDAPLAASSRSPAAAWQYATREAPVIWLVILLAALCSLVALRRRLPPPVWLLAAGLILPAGVLFLGSGQPRLLPPVLIGAAITFAAGAATLSQTWRGAPRWAAGMSVAALALVLGVAADRSAAAFADFYRVVDEPLLRAAAAIAVDDGEGSVVVRQDRRGWPIGWWFEALLDRPIIVGSDPRWLAFPEERVRAAEADALFNGLVSATEFRQLTEATGVRYLVAPKWEWIGWERWLDDLEFPVTVIFDDDRYIVLRVE